MSVTVASFKAAFPELQLAPPTLVQTALDDATLLCPTDVWGIYQDKGIRYTAARTIALSPFARELELASDNGQTIYDRELDDLRRIVAVGVRAL